MDVAAADGGDVLLRVKVIPGASRTKAAGVLGDRVKIAVAAPPEKGKANAALIAYLAQICGRRARDVTVETGQTASAKTVRICGVTAAQVRAALRLAE